MEENNYSAELEKLRAQIDEIDKKIIELLKRRIYIVSAVGELKKNSNEKFFIKSSREADMIKNLLKISGDKISQATIASIWRKIITNANLHEQKIRVAIHNPRNISDFEYLVREYYNSEVPLISFDSTGNVVSELENNLSQIGIFEIPSGENEVEKKEDIKENWWISLANNKSGLKVFTKIPFFDFGKENRFVEKFELVAVANKKPEKSSEDFTLLVIETAKEIKKSQIVVAFSEKNIAMRLLKFVSIKQFEEVNFSLVEIEGFYEENDLILKELSIHKIKPFVKVLGHYPKQILLNNSF